VRVLALVYAVAAYAVAALTILYAVGFVADLGVPKAIDAGPPGPAALAVVVDLALIGLFGLQHSVMARPAFKRRWTRLVPAPAERATYVLAASLTLALLFWLWRPLPQPVWRVTGPVATASWVVFWLGWGLALLSTFLIDHLELFGLRQAWTPGRAAAPGFRTPWLYRQVRHPLYLGFLLAFWAGPVMSAGRLLFALAATAYVLLGARLEERDLLASFGAAYADYRRRVPMLLPRPWRSGRD
jgi:protein-S-isoprenylcysteine O-methyltransferase Ste14